MDWGSAPGIASSSSAAIRLAARVALGAPEHDRSVDPATSTLAAGGAGDTIALVVFRAGTHRVGNDNGTLQVRTYREGLAQKVGHDLIIDVGKWDAAAEVREDGTLSAVQLNADPHSLQVREGLRGLKPLTDKDRADIRKTIDEKILGGRPIAFRSTAVEPGNGGLTVRGELELAGTRRLASFELSAAADGRVRGTLPVTQSEWGIKPYRGMMGALKVRDTIEVVLDVPLPSD
jgi:polyisoprenoid-binding protein YceI